jgi:ADP-heptose:LPS heptosyltransferase
LKILFIRFGSLGDTVLVTGVLRYFALNTANAHTIEVLTFTEYSRVFEGLELKIHTVPKGIPLAEYVKFLKTLPAFDVIVDLHSNLRSRLAGIILKGRVLRYNKRSAARRAFVKFRLCAKSLARHTVERYAEGFYPFFGLSLPEREELRPYISVNKEPPQRKNKKIIIHPFASRLTKEWRYFKDLSVLLSDLGFMVITIGKGGESFPNHVPTASISDLIDVMADACLLITTDSGPMHIGIALRLKVLALFGSTTKELGFYPDFSGCEVIEEELPCRPCHIHGAKKCKRGDFACMARISPEKVLETVLRIINAE